MHCVVLSVIDSTSVNDIHNIDSWLPFSSASSYLCHNLLSVVLCYPLIQVPMKLMPKLWVYYAFTLYPSENIMQAILDCFYIHKL